MVLILVLVVIPVLTLAALTYSELMLVEREASQVALRHVQARELAQSGIDAVRVFLSTDTDTQTQAGGWYDNPSLWSSQLVIDDPDPRYCGLFSLIAPALQEGDYAGIRYGIEDESARINLNTLIVIDRFLPGTARELLMALPGMDESIADAILDWMDSDDEPREYGAEADYYLALNPPYSPKNGPLESIEELLLVRGVTPYLLFGADVNRNGLIDPGEPNPASVPELQGYEDTMSRGWSAYLTLWSKELNIRSDGTVKIDVNQDDLEKLYTELEELFGSHWATYIVAYRQQEEPYQAGQSSEEEVETEPSGQLDLSRNGNLQLTTILDLIGQRVRVQYQGEEEAKILESPFPDLPEAMDLYLPLLMEHLTAVPNTVITGRININQAPRLVLQGLPGMTPEIVEEIIARRVEDPSQAEPYQKYETWILQEGIVTLEEMKALIPLICAGGDVYRVQAVGYFEREGPAARIEGVLDTTKRPAAILFWREMSHLGGFAAEAGSYSNFAALTPTRLLERLRQKNLSPLAIVGMDRSGATFLRR